MAVLEHEYVFEDSRIDKATLLPETLEALEEYDFNYRQNPLGYFYRLESKIKSYSEKEGRILTGRRQGADMHYARAGESGDSQREVVLWHNAWAQSVAPRTSAEEIIGHIEAENGTGADSNSWNKLILADFMYFTLKQAGVRSEAGDPLPVLSVPSPSLDRRGFLVKSKAKPIGKLAIASLDLCLLERFYSVHVGGSSLGAAVSAETVSRSRGHFDNIKSAFLGELPNASIRTFARFALDYLADGNGTEGDYTEDGPAARSDMIKGAENSHMASQAAGNRNALANLRLAADMSRGQAADSLRGLADNHVPTTLEYGEDSRVSAGSAGLLCQPAMHRLKDYDALQVLRAKNAPHIHSEHIVQTTDAMLRSVKFAGD